MFLYDIKQISEQEKAKLLHFPSVATDKLLLQSYCYLNINSGFPSLISSGEMLDSLCPPPPPPQVLRGKRADNPEVKQASVRRFATFELFGRTKPTSHDSSEEQWVEYTSVFFPDYGAFLR